jgi:polyisoprenoid-binding protein YceI
MGELMDNRLARTAAIAVLLGIAVAGVVWLFIFFSGGAGEASQPISAPQLTLPPATAAAAAPAPATAAPTTAAPATAAPATAAPQPQATQAPAAAQATGDAKLYRIVPEESEARFEIDEILRGEPTRVVGITDQVAGDIILDFADAAASQVGVIRINARTLMTDEDRRDRATRSRILQSAEDQYEFVEFTPTALEGLPGSVAVGDTASFTIVGDLKIRDITAEARFEATVNVVAEDRLEGTAETTVLRSTYNLVIPSVPFVADVGEEVLLGIRFVATAVDQ